MTLYKNDEKINALYRKSIDGVEFYRHAFSNETGYPIAPDEGAINYIFEHEGERIYKNLMFADLKIRSYNFKLLHFPPSEDYKNKNQIFSWEEGTLYRLYTINKTVYKENFAYIHFLKRSIAVSEKLQVANRFLIVPNAIIALKEPITAEIIELYSKEKYYWKYIID